MRFLWDVFASALILVGILTTLGMVVATLLSHGVLVGMGCAVLAVASFAATAVFYYEMRRRV